MEQEAKIEAMGTGKNSRKSMSGSHSRATKSSMSDARRLTERMKELECLYKISDLVEDPSVSFSETLQGIADILPPSFQYPHISTARLSLSGQVFQTATPHRTRATLSSPIKVHGQQRGSLEVSYTQERPPAGEGPFLHEERRLLDAVAERIGRIVERHEAVEALTVEHEFLRTFLDVLSDIVFVVDLDGNMIRWNRMVSLLSGYTDDEIATMTAWDFFDSNSVEPAKHALIKAVLEGNARVESVMRTKAGDRVDMEFTGATMRDALGAVAHVCGIGRDVTMRRKEEEAMRRSEEKFRTIFNSVGDSIFVTSLDGRILDANAAAMERYGYSREELLTMRRGDFRAISYPLLEPEDVQDVVGNWQEPVQTVHRRKDGREFPVERLRRLIQYEGKPAVLAVIRDITERKKAEEALAESREEYKSIANLSGDIILKADAAGRVTFVNDGACEFYGKARDELLGIGIRGLRHPDDHTGTDAIIAGFKSGDEGVYGFTNRHRSAQGWKTVQWNAIPLFEGGEYLGFQATGRDIADQMRAEEELRLLNAELEGFAHTVSHDLRGPLAAILLASEAFTDFADAPAEEGAHDQMLRMADVIRRNVDRARALIVDLITLARADKFNEETELIDISRMVDSILEERAGEIAERGVRIEVGDDLGQTIASSTHIYQLFSNLIGNALKYCCTSAGEPEISLRRTRMDAEGHHYILRDNGPGMPEEVLEHAFEPFVKGDEGGTGIGLAIVAKIVGAYGGSISVANEDGAVFRFNLHDAVSE